MSKSIKSRDRGRALFNFIATVASLLITAVKTSFLKDIGASYDTNVYKSRWNNDLLFEGIYWGKSCF